MFSFFTTDWSACLSTNRVIAISIPGISNLKILFDLEQDPSNLVRTINRGVADLNKKVNIKWDCHMQF